MKCPYRKIILHQPDREEGMRRIFARDIEDFAECYGKECPFYRSETNGLEITHERCEKATSEVTFYI